MSTDQNELEPKKPERRKTRPATDAEWRALIKPIVLQMESQNLTRIVIIKNGGAVDFSAS